MVLKFICPLFILPATAGRLYETYQDLSFSQNHSRAINYEQLQFSINYHPTGFT
jgi:hypothetical protein